MPVAGATAQNGPQADYPLVIGAPYMVDGVQYAPADVLNYDEVGFVTAGTGEGITGGHHTLPYPAYVEVTSLESGRTILVPLEWRGPMDSDHLISLSPVAMAQLEASQDTPVRVRRVNPPEEQRALLRAGEAAPLRMDTPMGLVEVLKRRLPAEGSASLRAGYEVPSKLVPAEAPAIEELAPLTVAESQTMDNMSVSEGVTSGTFETVSFDEAFAHVEAEEPLPVRTSGSQPASIKDGFVVQAAALSDWGLAQSLAGAIGGRVEQVGNLYRVRTGPFATRAQAEASLANVQAAGYTEARIFKTG